ncbi:MAG: ATPase, T2SS/T4P/T4SS family [Acetobacteraceae bacterium]|nr:ATPase, T2SS/T4P/T4SS family [Acetobacteraceae bacterium]
MDVEAPVISRPILASNVPVEMPAIPDRIRDFVAVDLPARILHVERRILGDPHLMTWVSRCEGAGLRLTMKPADMDELARLREKESQAVRPGDEDLHNRLAALELVRRAAELRASDIHLLMPATHAEIQVRIKGDLKVLDRLTYAEGEALARSLYQSIATARDASYNPLELQNAQISGRELADTGLTSVRIVRGPAFPVEENGSFMILRLQYASTAAARGTTRSAGGLVRVALVAPRRPEGELRLREMGFTPKQEKAMRLMAEAPNGVVILTGPTGSGKTSTIFECMSHLAREYPGRRQISIEDPVEYPMPWAIQLEVTNATTETETGLAFAHRLRAALRMDPDIIMSGEVRGADVGVATINAALTGHLVYTTLHVTDPFLAIDRLEMMDRERLHRQMICDHTIIRGLVAQRLVPRLCDACAVDLAKDRSRLPPEIYEALETYGDLSKVRVRGEGCKNCGGDAISGRVAVAEVVVTTPELMRDFVDNGTEAARRNHRRRKGADGSLLENVVDRVLAGLIDPNDIGRFVDRLVPRESQPA